MVKLMGEVERRIREEIAQRAKLRADNLLPPLDVEAEVVLEMALARRRTYDEEEAKHEADWRRIWTEVYAECRAARNDPGWPHSSGGHTMAYRIARQRFRGFLEQKGVPHVPFAVRNAVVYGSNKPQTRKAPR
jgi:hypothetical protein